MTDLTPLDAGFLEVEDADRHASLVIGGATICDGPVPSQREFVEAMRERIAGDRRYRRVLRTYPLYLGAPRWVEDPHFDLAHHVRRVAVPAPGGDDEVFALIGAAMSSRMDRDRPLWQCWLVEGLAGGRWAILTKVHHSIADGITATHMLAGMFDAPASSFSDAVGHAPASHHDPRVSRRDRLSPARVGRQISRVLDAAVGVGRGATELAAEVLRPAPSSILHGVIATQRRYAVARAAMVDIAAICAAYEVTVNDVVLAAVASGYGAVLSSRETRSSPHMVRTAIPVSTRSPADTRGSGNRVSVMIIDLPVGIAEPIETLKAVHRMSRRSKHSGQWQAADLLVEAVRLLPFAFSAWTVRFAASVPHGVEALVTNVPGPRRPVTVLGREVVEILPVPPIALQLRTVVAILSYADTLSVGISGDYDTADYIDELADAIQRAIVAMADAANRSRSSC